MLNRKRSQGATLLIALGVIIVLGIIGSSVLSTRSIGWNIDGIEQENNNRRTMTSEVGDSALAFATDEDEIEFADWEKIGEILKNASTYGPDEPEFGVDLGSINIDAETIERRGYFRGKVGAGSGCFGMDVNSFDCVLIEVVTRNSKTEIRQGYAIPVRRTL